VRKGNMKGFSLLELMVAVVIIGILAAIAIPNYNAYMVKTRRSTAKSELQNLANAMERHYTTTNSYTGAGTTGGDTGAPTIYPAQVPNDGTAYYNLTIEAVTQTTYTLRATPIATGPQAGDGYLELLSTGARRWDKNNDGDTADAGENSWQD